MNDGDRIDFRIVHPFDDTYEGLGTICYRAGFENWERPEAFVVQLEAASGYDTARDAVEWMPIARFDHGRPHDVFDPEEGLHIDLYRQGEPIEDYEHMDIGFHLRPRDPLGAFTRLQQVFDRRPNREYVIAYYRGTVNRFRPSVLTL